MEYHLESECHLATKIYFARKYVKSQISTVCIFGKDAILFLFSKPVSCCLIVIQCAVKLHFAFLKEHLSSHILSDAPKPATELCCVWYCTVHNCMWYGALVVYYCTVHNTVMNVCINLY